MKHLNGLTARATGQVRQHVDYWLEDHPKQESVSLACGSLYVDDYNGSLAQMKRAVAGEFVARGWAKKTVKGMKMLVRVP